jgi:hypothetical protein
VHEGADSVHVGTGPFEPADHLAGIEIQFCQVFFGAIRCVLLQVCRMLEEEPIVQVQVVPRSSRYPVKLVNLGDDSGQVGENLLPVFPAVLAVYGGLHG